MAIKAHAATVGQEGYNKSIRAKELAEKINEILERGTYIGHILVSDTQRPDTTNQFTDGTTKMIASGDPVDVSEGVVILIDETDPTKIA
jgi:hypothetical protein